jgi:hypothetical protein
MEHDTQIVVRLPADLKAAIARAADADQRTLAAMVRVILTRWQQREMSA